MVDTVVGVMWCKNEHDLLPHTIPAALKHVDCLMVVDDDSDDGSWDIIKSFRDKLEYAIRRVDKISDTPYTSRVFARQHLLDEVRRRFGVENVWVQVIESDVAILDTDVRDVIKRCAVNDVSVRWHMLNACRRVWTPEYDLPRIPAGVDLHEFFDACHWMEQVTYTFRPLPFLEYTERPTPWPQGFGCYVSKETPGKLSKKPDSPLVVHYGFRSPTFYYEKIKNKPKSKKRSVKYPAWDLSSPESIKNSVSFFNSDWNDQPFRTFEPISREGWIEHLKVRHLKNGE